MSEIIQLTSTLHTGYHLVQRLHAFYIFANKFPFLFPFNALLFLLILPVVYIRFVFLNMVLEKLISSPPLITFENYMILKQQLCLLEEHVKYFHTFFNADKRALSWFMRPLFPQIKKHIHAQADYRNMLQEKMAGLNSGKPGSRFTFLKEAALWEYRNKAYSYLA